MDTKVQIFYFKILIFIEGPARSFTATKRCSYGCQAQCDTPTTEAGRLKEGVVS